MIEYIANVSTMGLIWKAFGIPAMFKKREGHGLQSGRGVIYSVKGGVRVELMKWTVLPVAAGAHG